MAKKEKVKEPKYVTSTLGTQMENYRAYYLNAGQKILFSILTFVAGGFAGYIFYGGLFKDDEGEATTATYIANIVIFAVVGLVAIKIFVPTIRNMLMKRRNKNLEVQFMDLLDCLSTSLSAGATLFDAFMNAKRDMSAQYDDSAMIMRELDEIISGMSNGENIETKLSDFGNRSGNEEIMNFANVISDCYRTGGNFKDVVRKTRDIIADNIAVADEVATKITSNKMQLNVMSIMPIVIVGMMKLMNPQFADNLGSVLGVIVTTIAIAMFVGAYIFGQKIIDIKV